MPNCINATGRMLDLCECKGHDGRPDPDPRMCEAYRKQMATDWNTSMPSRGVGDVIAKVTSAVGIKPCGGCKGRQGTLNNLFPFAHSQTSTPPFITTTQLMIDAKTLASMIPVNASRIIGVSRSGLCVASMVAMLLHRPIDIVRQSTGDIISGGNGWRLTGAISSDGPAVVIDDTVMSGNSFKHVMPIVRKEYPGAMSAAVYVNPAAKVKPDIWVRDLHWPHLLEWNLFNSIMTPALAVDFDGILCQDCRADQDDDGVEYAKFLETVQPLYYVRRVNIPMVVTARLEKYRPQTMSWLERHGMKVDNLVMGPWSNNHERAHGDVAGYKAEHFVKFRKLKHAIKPPIFVESDPIQALRIAHLSGGFVACPAAGRCYP